MAAPEGSLGSRQVPRLRQVLDASLQMAAECQASSEPVPVARQPWAAQLQLALKAAGVAFDPQQRAALCPDEVRQTALIGPPNAEVPVCRCGGARQTWLLGHLPFSAGGADLQLQQLRRRCPHLHLNLCAHLCWCAHLCMHALDVRSSRCVIRSSTSTLFRPGGMVPLPAGPCMAGGCPSAASAASSWWAEPWR